MSAQRQPDRMDQEIEQELARRLDVAKREHQHAQVEIAGTRYWLVPVEAELETTDDPAAGYDPQRALAAVTAGFGAFTTLDIDAFLADMLEAREQDTPRHAF
jgi:hypothetical protein